MATYFQGAVQSGAYPSKYLTKYGNAVFEQTASISRDATLVQTGTFEVPANAKIVDIVIDVTAAYDSATSATVTVGSAAGGSQYAGSVDAKTEGRVRPTFTAAQLSAIASVGSNTSVYCTVTSVGQPTSGSIKATLLYSPTE